MTRIDTRWMERSRNTSQQYWLYRGWKLSDSNRRRVRHDWIETCSVRPWYVSALDHPCLHPQALCMRRSSKGGEIREFGRCTSPAHLQPRVDVVMLHLFNNRHIIYCRLNVERAVVNLENGSLGSLCLLLCHRHRCDEWRKTELEKEMSAFREQQFYSRTMKVMRNTKVRQFVIPWSNYLRMQ